MGRKPNSLILANFVRGAKLDNNRYVQSCRSCGQKFPKGRIESLTKHLLKECPAAPLEHPLPDLVDFHPPPTPFSDDTTMAVAALHQPLPPMALPFATKQSMSALEALAEVSRQHLDYRGSIRGSRGRMSSPNGYSPDDYLVSDDRPTEDEENNNNSRAFGANHTNGAQLPPIYNFNGMQPSAMGSPHLPSLLATTGAISTPRMVPSPLQMAASAANELIMPNGGSILEPGISLLNNGPQDRPFNSPRQGSSWSIDPVLHNNMAPQLPYPESPGSRGPHLRPIAINPHTTPSSPSANGADISSSPGSAKSKGRSRFTDSRRKEVKEVRKRGACMRCRMLKKPCSEGTPCSTCLNVESARLWKYPCIRTRVAEEFDLYGAGLYTLRAMQHTDQTRSRMIVRNDTGHIRVSHFPDASIFGVFPAVQGPFAGDGYHDSNLSWVQMIDANTGIDIGGEIELYMRRMMSEFIKAEISPFMRLTLWQAYNMDTDGKPDSLISRVLELWVATVILTNPNLKFHYFLTHSKAPASDNSESNIQVEPILNPDSTSIIEAQLQSAIEKRAIVYSKFVMNELERRLLQRQQANPFETFLVAIILLACTERMCWLFKTWEVTGDIHGSNHTSGPRTPVLSNNHIKADYHQLLPQSPRDGVPMSPSIAQDYSPLPPNGRWPLVQPPHHYYLKGERFSDILQMLLRMRGVPPKTAVQPSVTAHPTGLSRPGENVLHALKQITGPARPEESAVSHDWFEALGISMEEFQRRRESQWVRDDCRSWEGKFLSKLFMIAS